MEGGGTCLKKIGGGRTFSFILVVVWGVELFWREKRMFYFILQWYMRNVPSSWYAPPINDGKRRLKKTGGWLRFGRGFSITFYSNKILSSDLIFSNLQKKQRTQNYLYNCLLYYTAIIKKKLRKCILENFRNFEEIDGNFREFFLDRWRLN